MKQEWEIEDYADHIRTDCDFDPDLIRFRSGVFQSCVPLRFQEVKDSDVTHNRAVWEKFILPYEKKFKSARHHGFGIYLEGSNGVGKTMFMSYLLVQAVRAGYSAYYTTAMDLDYDMKRGFSDREVATRIEEMLWSDFWGFDELGGEQFKSGDNWAKMQVERVLKFRLDNKLPTIVASNSNPRKIESAYGPSVRSILTGSYQHVLLDGGDFRGKIQERMHSLMGYKK